MSSGIWTAIALSLLAITDAGFSGFRAFAGRDGRINKRSAKIKSLKRGALAGLPALAIIGAIALGAIALGLTDFDELTSAGNRMLAVYAIYATLIALGFAGYFSPWLEVRSVSTVVVMGPGTFIRPTLIVGGAMIAAWGNNATVWIVALLAAITMLATEKALDWSYADEAANVVA